MTDPVGNVLKDAGHHTTQYNYSDNPAGGNAAGASNAYLTGITRPATNGVQHNSSFAYDYASGHLVSEKDENGHATTYWYDDPFGRLTKIVYPDQSTTTYRYSESSLPFTEVTVDKGIASEVVVDGLGHATQTCKQAATGWTIVDRKYDGFGRVCKVSNPYVSTSCSGSGATLWTTTWYDAVGRVIEVDHPDGSKFTTDYNGGQATTTDEAKHVRRTYTDTLGRIVKVEEPAPVTAQ